MASTATEKRKCTYEDYLKTPDDERYELVGGELLMTPSSVPKHHIMENDLWLRMGESDSKTGGELNKSLEEVKRLCRHYAQGMRNILFKNWIYRMKIRVGYSLCCIGR